MPAPLWPHPCPIQAPFSLVAVKRAGAVDRAGSICEQVSDPTRIDPVAGGDARSLKEVITEIALEAQRPAGDFTVHPDGGIDVDTLACESMLQPLPHWL